MSALAEAPDGRVSLTLPEAAVSLGVSLSTFRRHVLPSIKAIRVGKCVVVSVAELSNWAERNGTLNTPTDF